MRILVPLFLMFISPVSVFFFTTLLMGIILRVSSDSWFGAWCGLELNLISFIPFIRSKINQYSSEASLKYFLIQALGSSVIILGFILILISVSFVFLIRFALLLKLGAAPVHSWFPQVIEGLNWERCLVLITVQKIAPIYLISYIVYFRDTSIIFFRRIISAVVGALGGVNQILLRKLLAFSSINHIAWMLLSILISESSWVLYFIFYSFISMSVVSLFNYQQFFHFNQLSNFTSYNSGLVRFLSLLSLGGLPPFTGFVPKWIVIQELIIIKYFFCLFFFLLSSLVTLYYYLRVTIVYITFLSPKLKFNLMLNVNSKLLSFFTSLNFVGLIFPSLFILV